MVAKSRELMTRDELLACLRATEERRLPSEGRCLPPGAGALVVGPLLGAMLWALGAACWAAWPSFVAALGR